MTEKLIEPKSAKPKPLANVATPPATKVFVSIRAPEPVAEMAPPKFTPCAQCGNPGGCARANRCVKGFK